MIQTTGAILIPVGIVFFFIFIFWFLFTIPIALSLFFSRDNLQLAGNVAIKFGVIRFILPINRSMEGTIEFFSKPLWSFPLSSSEVMEKEEKAETGMLDRSIGDVIDLFPLFITYLRRIIRFISIDRITCHACFGCGDPFTTGITYGYLQAIIPILGQKGHDIFIFPDFEKPALRGEVGMNILIRTPISLIILACRLFIPAILRARINGKSNEKYVS